MAGIRKALGSLLGPTGRTPQLVNGTTTQVDAGTQASVELVKIGEGRYRMDAKVPKGIDGDPSGITELAAAMAAALNTAGSDPRAALFSAIREFLGSGGVEVLPFEGFTIPVTITKSMGVYSATIDHEAMHTRGTGSTMYVDPVNGDNANDGLSWATAKADPGNATFDRGDYGVAEVVIRGGVYTRTESNLGVPFRPQVIARSESGTKAVLTQGDTSTAWTVHSGSAFKVTMTGTGFVVDRSEIGSDGYPLVLDQVDDIGTVVATPGTAYHDGSTQYVHLHDSRAPDQDVLVGRNTYHLNTTLADPGQPMSILTEGVEFWGGLYARVRGWRAGDLLISKNSAWRYAAENGLGLQAVDGVLIGCEATHNGIDGFNYHDIEGRSGQVLEIDCIGSHNGQLAGGSSQNGTTAHENYRIVRVGGEYESNPGPNVADVNHVLSANYGVTAGNALGYDGVADFDYTAPEGGGRIWLFGCRSTSSKALRNAKDAVVDDFQYVGTIEGGTPTPAS